MLVPAQLGHETGHRGIAALGPEAIQRLIARRPRRVVIGPDDSSKAGHAGPAGAGLCLAVVKEGMADAVAAIFGQQHAFAKVEQPRQVPAPGHEGLLEFALLLGHRRCGRRADNPVAVKGRHQHRAFGLREFGQILRLVGRIAGVEVGVGRKDRDPQPRKVVQRPGDSAPVSGRTARLTRPPAPSSRPDCSRPRRG